VLEPVPSLDQLAEDPGKLSALSPALVLALRCRLTVLLAHVEHQVAVQGLAPTTPPARDGGEPDRRLSPKEAAALLGTTRRWLRSHDVPGRIQLGHKTVVYAARAIEKYLRQRTAK
jgi:predicted DNA-binding transcriptional regulator AlpA